MNKKMQIFVFLLVFLAILFLAHFVFYDYLLRFFSLNNIVLKRIIIFVMILMPVLFIVSMISMRSNDILLTRVIYFISGIWLGVLMNFLVIIFSSWFFVGLMKIFKIHPGSLFLLVIGVIGVAVVTVLSVYGTYNALHVSVKNIAVNAENFPVFWQGKKAVHLSDIHLGSILRSGHMDKIYKEIEVIKPDIIFITGDLFDSVDGNMNIFQASLKKLYAPEGVFFVTGNHETYLGLDEMEKILKGTNIIILDNKIVEIAGLQIIGIAYPERMEEKNIVENIKKLTEFDSEKTNILLYHEPIQISEIKGAGIDLMLSGHTHKGQVWPVNFITNTIFRGYDYGLFKEDNFYLNVSSGAGFWGPTMRTSGKNEIVVIDFKHE